MNRVRVPSAAEVRLELERQSRNGYLAEEYVNWGRTDQFSFVFTGGGSNQLVNGAQQLVRAETRDKVPTTWNLLLFADLLLSKGTGSTSQVLFTVTLGCGSAQRQFTKLLALTAAAPSAFFQFTNLPGSKLYVDWNGSNLQTDNAQQATLQATAMAAPVFL
jgi:hypothetical protein